MDMLSDDDRQRRRQLLATAFASPRAPGKYSLLPLVWSDSEAEIPRYNLLSRDKLMDGARIAAERGAKTYCIVISARGPNEREMAAVTKIVPEIKEKFGLQICACLGLLTGPDLR